MIKKFIEFISERNVGIGTVTPEPYKGTDSTNTFVEDTSKLLKLSGKIRNKKKRNIKK